MGLEKSPSACGAPGIWGLWTSSSNCSQPRYKKLLFKNHYATFALKAINAEKRTHLVGA